MPIYWLSQRNHFFPDPRLANDDGIVAVGGDVSPSRLLEAYKLGIFPWYSDNDPILWWSPDPRMVLFPDDLKVSKSMRTFFNNKKFSVTFDTCFQQVIQECRRILRHGQYSTWISDDIVKGYVGLHRLGYAHSCEVWHEGQLVGGLYGVMLGKVFFGESMFAKMSNASKFGFISLVKWLKERQVLVIDCQQETEHLASLGAKTISREQFLAILAQNRAENIDLLRGGWNADET